MTDVSEFFYFLLVIVCYLLVAAAVVMVAVSIVAACADIAASVGRLIARWLIWRQRRLRDADGSICAGHR